MEITRSVLVPFSAEGMFDLIEQAENYPAFVPWCTGAQILERSDEWVSARIEFAYLRMRFGFATRNPKRRPEWLQVRAIDGPFRRFVGDWRFTPLGDLGCKVAFEVSYEMTDGMLDRVALPAVETVTRTIVNAFIQRAEQTLQPLSPTPAAPPPPAAPLSTALPGTPS